MVSFRPQCSAICCTETAFHPVAALISALVHPPFRLSNLPTSAVLEPWPLLLVLVGRGGFFSLLPLVGAFASFFIFALIFFIAFVALIIAFVVSSSGSVWFFGRGACSLNSLSVASKSPPVSRALILD